MKNNTDEEMYRQIVESSAEAIIIQQDGKFMYINPAGVTFLRAASSGEVIGKSVSDIIPEQYAELTASHIKSILEENKPTGVIEKKLRRFDGSLVDVKTNCTPIQYEGKKAVLSVVRDVTRSKEIERELERVSKEIYALSVPIVPVLEGVAVMPLVGTIDSDRAQYILENVPIKVQEQKVHTLISDFSGIYELDQMVIDFLFRTSAVLGLLGVRSVVSGVSPAVARSVVQLGADLSLIQIFGTVQQAIKDLSVKE
ncbi:PAS domain S-box protein [Peribacillus glennii]|uniref:PAS domain S-box protein n=1 Tax=Peribacillus glennii TaxID=2303991 RepID=A0A372L6Q8_9BACI|nr:PAS domain S-box protein [Peribacillus glennii]RFU60777.1 PAS domain S-box protein [Peribacillus glennii]